MSSTDMGRPGFITQAGDDKRIGASLKATEIFFVLPGVDDISEFVLPFGEGEFRRLQEMAQVVAF